MSGEVPVIGKLATIEKLRFDVGVKNDAVPESECVEILKGSRSGVQRTGGVR
jgi:hypothetical protein